MAGRSKIFDNITLSISNAFSHPNWYRIPIYQRPYVWEDEKVEELLSDIYQAMSDNPKSNYFLGVILLSEHRTKTKTIRYTEYDVIDGQQRLITLLLTFAVMRDAVIKIKDENNPSKKNFDQFIDDCQGSIYQKKNKRKKIPERTRILFQTRNDVDSFIERYIDRESETQNTIPLNNNLLNKYKNETSVKHMCSAIRVINEFFNGNNFNNKKFEYSHFNAFSTYIFTGVQIISITSSSKKLSDTHSIFETLNARGLKLRPSDILKSQNLDRIIETEKREIYSKKWDEFENKLNNYSEKKDQSYFDNLLSHIRTILIKDKAKKTLLKEFEDKIYGKEFDGLSEKLDKGEPILKCIEKYYDLFTELFIEDFKANDSYKVNNLISLMEELLPSDYWIAALLRYYEKFKDKKLEDFLIRLDNKVSYDWIVKETPTTRIVNINKILKELDKVGNSKKIDPKKINDFLKNDCFKIDLPKFKNTLDGQDIYHTRHVKYLLYKLNFLNNDNDHTWNIATSKIGIEHILPQKPSKSSQWVRDFNKKKIEIWTHKLGNLMLIGRRKNKKLSNKDFKDKIKTYYGSKVLSNFPHSAKIYQYKTWTPKDLANNHEESFDKLLAHYKLNPH